MADLPLPPDSLPFDAALAAERARLVRLCAHLTQTTEAAEDLAQESLLEAWRQRHKLSDAAALQPWLAAIARNVCLRWRRRRGHEATYGTAVHSASAAIDDADHAPAPFDVELELERHELADLLDRALALLPPATRAVLVQRYIEDRSQADIAAQLGTTEGAVEARLQRGKLTLRRVLTTHHAEALVPYGVAPATEVWQATRIWCPFCGRRHLMCRRDPAYGGATFRCPDQCTRADGHIATTYRPSVIAGVRTFKAILNRQVTWLNQQYRTTLAQAPMACAQCRVVDAERQGDADRPPHLRLPAPIDWRCAACRHAHDEAAPFSLRYLVLDLPVTQRFWRANPKMRVLPDRPMTYVGRAALLTAYESLSRPARLEVISDATSLAVLAVHGVPAI